MACAKVQVTAMPVKWASETWGEVGALVLNDMPNPLGGSCLISMEKFCNLFHLERETRAAGAPQCIRHPTFLGSTRFGSDGKR